MRCLIILNARDHRELSEKDADFYRSMAERSDFVICADGGINTAKAAGIPVDLVVGDMDSAESEILSGIAPERLIKYPSEKDRTDGWLALQKAIEIGCSDISMCSALSPAPDHTIANIQMLASVPKGVKARISEPDMDVHVLESGEMSIAGTPGDRVSILPLSEKAEGISLRGLKYSADEASFSIKGMNGISNEMSSEKSVIKVEKGILAVFHHRSI